MQLIQSPWALFLVWQEEGKWQMQLSVQLGCTMDVYV